MLKKIKWAVIPGVVVLGLILQALASTALPPLESTVGEFTVDKGNPNYAIPITTPPGTAGKVPQLSLGYSRSADSSLAGSNFTLNGLSAVTRCPKTIALDGVRGGVNYDSDDRFCLDAQRLIVVQGSYGADGTEYRTERETFSRIYSYGSQGGGPQSFKVHAKDGSVTEYGVTEDSRIEASGKSVVRLWAMNKSLDVMGNYYAVTYTEDNPNGDYRPERIDYTGNTAAGLTPYNKVQFEYESRPDIATRYEGGSVMRTTQRLKNIQTLADSTLTREYRLNYDASGALVDPSVPKPGLEGWSWTSSVRRVDDGGSNFMADVNGDGKKDHVFVAPEGAPNARAVHVGLSANGGFEG
ncbi:MAG TPA: SpvB/TcaC N-terminal domain-containing protein, partial [Candidatus Saccharimonadales bacterium]|nr:SpvB/TcaC N-terminal domain-containing protein [Candidatus Saccharimonadales bacterium]